MKTSTAIIIFTRTAPDEAKHKCFIPSGNSKANRLIAKTLIRHTVGTVRKAGLPYYTIYSDQQQGETFGERIGSSMRQVFDNGYDNVIVIGNDCPEVSKTILLEANAAFELHNAVIGPATDGGAYLIGISRKQFEALEQFKDVYWESDEMLSSLVSLLDRTSTSFVTLELKEDIDNCLDISKHFCISSFLNVVDLIIKSILASARKSVQSYQFSLVNFIKECAIGLRAPPCYC